MLLDASGKPPVPVTAFERRVAERTESGAVSLALAALQEKQNLPLAEKVKLSLELIQDWYESWGGMVSISYSGGKDSEVLKHLVRSIYPEIPAVFAHTGLEYPEVVRQVMNTENHVVLRPKMPFRRVVSEYGWPIGSKKIARGVSIVRNPTGKNQNVTRLYLEGVNRFGRQVHGYKIPLQWRFLIDAPFPISDKCCDVMKKKPMAKYERETGRRPMVGTMASDSKQRQRAYLLEGGCNAYDMKRPRSAPLSFWTQQDILKFIYENKLNIPSVYGEIRRKSSDGSFYTTGVSHTGCVFCCFGLSLDEGPKNRFEQLAETHPNLHRYVMDRLGLGEVLMNRYHGTAYIDHNGDRIRVSEGIGGGDIFFSKRGNHRLKSPALPLRESAAEAQADLDAYAAKKGWREALDQER